MKRLAQICAFLILPLALAGHPLHLSVTNIVLENGKLKVIMKTFPDDWETAYFHYHGKVIDYSDPIMRSETWFGEYLEKSFRLSLGENQDTLKLKTDTLVHTMESMTIEMSATLSSKPKTLYIYQSLLTDIYPDQTNLVIFKSGKRETGIKFDVGKHEERLELE